MKRTLLIFLLGAISLPLWSQNNIVKKVSGISGLQTLPLFYAEESKARKAPGDTLTKLVIHAATLKTIQESRPGFLSISLPGHDGTSQTLDLVAQDIHAPGFSVQDAAGRELSTATGLHYSGMIRGNDHSLTSLSFTPYGISGFIADETGNYELTQMPDEDVYTLIPASAVKREFHCSVTDDIPPITPDQVKHIGSADFVNCRAVEIYFEADYTIFSSFGSIEATTDYVNRLFAQVAILYENEGVAIKMSGLKVWNTPDPYEAARSNSSDLLSVFSDRIGETGFKGNLAHLLTKSNIGGRAYIIYPCNSVTAFSTGVTGSIRDDIENYPLYSGDVKLLAHELGHNFGLPHTHSCYWPGGPIDNCAPPEGNCADTRNIPQNGGTIMSYCGININFSLGFGQLPGDLMRNNAVFCFGGRSAVTHLRTVETSASQAYLSWETPDRFQNHFEIEYKENNATEWIKTQTSNPQIKLTGLKPDTPYQWRVKTACAGFAESTFRTTTQPGFCDTEFIYTSCYYYAPVAYAALNHRLLGSSAFCSDKAYTFHFDQVKELTIGNDHSFELRMNELQYPLFATVWIDSNNNRVFEDHERVFTSKEPFLRTLNGNFHLSNGIAPVSKARMRIMVSTSGAQKDPCGKEYLGEVLDYYVNLVTCTGSPRLPDNVLVKEVTASHALFTWNSSAPADLLIEYREKGTEGWTGFWTEEPGISLPVQPNIHYEWRLSRPCSGYLTGEFTSPKVEYCTTRYQYPWNCATEYRLEKFIVPEAGFTVNTTSCSADGNLYYPESALKLVTGKVYPFSLLFRKTYMYIHATIWIDLNGNGRFEDDEKVYTSHLPYPEEQRGVFTIPAHLPNVTDTRMRILISNGNPTYPCDDQYTGQTIDLPVHISKNCDAYTVTNISVVHPTACTKGNLDILLNGGDGDMVTFHYTKNGVQGTFQGIISKTRVSILEVSGGDYHMESFTIGSCTIPLDQTVTLHNPPPLKPVASNTGPYLAGNTIRLSVDSGEYFQWEGPGQFYAGEQSPVIPDATVAHSGVYKVVVTDADKCRAEASTTVVVDPLLANEPGSENIGVKIYPNPAYFYFKIEVPFDEETSGSVIAADGKALKTFAFKKEALVSTGKLVPGVYTVKIKNSRQEASVKIIVL